MPVLIETGCIVFMVDISKQIEYWHQGAQEDWLVAQQLVESGKIRHGLFFAHLALEKLLKAHVCKKTNDLAPRIHNLIRLFEAAQIEMNPTHKDVLAVMNEFNLEGRYPLEYVSPPTHEEARDYLQKSYEVMQWLIQKL
jgi:HEPN domain-containing protein